MQLTSVGKLLNKKIKVSDLFSTHHVGRQLF